jgi:hypothetical protein
MFRWKTPQAGVYRLVNLIDDKVYVVSVLNGQETGT